MSPTGEFLIKLAIGVVVLGCVTEGGLLVVKLVLTLAPGHYQLSATAGGLVFIIGFILLVIWMNRQARHWWDNL